MDGRRVEGAPPSQVGYVFQKDTVFPWRTVSRNVALGLEYYASLGPVKHLDRWSDQQQQIFPVIDVDLGPRWEFNFGVGFGMTPSTDRLIVKMILGYRFEWAGGRK